MDPSTPERREDQLQRAMDKYHEDLKSLVATQGWHGNWNYSPNMRGLYNGLELALATFEDRSPVYKDEPEEYLCNMDEPEPENEGSTDVMNTTGNPKDMAAAEAFRRQYETNPEPLPSE